EAVVDGLEPVEVGEDQRHGVVRRGRPGHGVVGAVHEAGAVGQPGDRVVEGVAHQVALELEALQGGPGDVGDAGDGPGDPLQRVRAGAHADPAPAALAGGGAADLDVDVEVGRAR